MSIMMLYIVKGHCAGIYEIWFQMIWFPLKHNTLQKVIIEGFAEIWTRIAGVKVQSANHYTTKPMARVNLEI